MGQSHKMKKSTGFKGTVFSQCGAFKSRDSLEKQTGATAH